MSIRTVKSQIKKALANDPSFGCVSGKRIDAKEGKRIVREAEKGYVSNGEGKLIGDLFSRQMKPTPPGFAVTLACPENPGAVSFDQDAVKSFNKFFVKHDLPYGDNAASVKTRIQDTVNEVGYGEEMCKAPNIKHLHHVFMRDSRPVDGDRLDAFVDARKGVFYLKSTGAGMAGPDTVGPYWYGPHALPEASKAPPKVTDKTRQDIISSWKASEPLEYQYGLQPPAGSKFVRVPLQGVLHPDGYQYTALVPAGALAPGAEPKDPNKATQFFVERSGGFAGLTALAGPVQIKEAKPEVQLPQGIYKLGVSALSTFGMMAPIAIVNGELNSGAYKAKIGKPVVDEATATVSIPVSAEMTTDGPAITATQKFDQFVPLSELAGKNGLWKINLVDTEGNVLRSTEVNQQNII